MPKSPELDEQGRRLRAMRDALGITREEFARRLGLKVGTLKGAENGQQKMGFRTMADAERLAAGEGPTSGEMRQAHVGTGVAEAYAHYGAMPGKCQKHMDGDIAEVLRAARDEAVKAAAAALAVAAGITEEEAMVAVIRERLRPRN